MRVKGGTVTRKRHQVIRQKTRGYRMTRGRLYRVSHEAYLHAGNYAFQGRKSKKRNFRRLWISRLNAALKPFSIRYNTFTHQLDKQQIILNRQILARLAYKQPEIFAQ